MVFGDLNNTGNNNNNGFGAPQAPNPNPASNPTPGFGNNAAPNNNPAPAFGNNNPTQVTPNNGFGQSGQTQGFNASPNNNTQGAVDLHLSEAEGSNVISFVNSIIENAIMLKVSDIHVEPYDDTTRLRYRKDGVLKEVKEYRDFLKTNFSAVVTRIKILSSLDISERRLPQDGAIAFNLSGDRVDLRVSVLPTGNGERVVMRIMDKSSLTLPLDQLGFPEKSIPLIEKAIRAPQGMILVTGPTGSGKSTTLYAVLNELNKEDVNILTAEDPVEFDVEGIGQVQVKESIGLDFPAALKSFLRQDPEIIMVGEIRDKDTGDISVKASLTGHLVLSTLHTNSAPSTITRMINMGIPNYLISSSLSLVIAQRLARVNCPHCTSDDTSIDQEALMGFGFKSEEIGTFTPKVGKGCERCFNTGVKGRKAIHEVLAVTKNIKDAILKNASDIELEEIAKTKDGFESMQRRGRDLIKEGVLSIAEYQRVLTSED